MTTTCPFELDICLPTQPVNHTPRPMVANARFKGGAAPRRIWALPRGRPAGPAALALSRG